MIAKMEYDIDELTWKNKMMIFKKKKIILDKQRMKNAEGIFLFSESILDLDKKQVTDLFSSFGERCFFFRKND